MPTDRRRGADPSLLVLISLAAGPKHGHGMLLDIERFSGQRLGPGTLYGAIERLELDDLIEALPGDERRRPYRLTASGSAYLAGRLDSIERLAGVGRSRDIGMKRLMRMALRLYPEAWRRRYGPEVGQLIDDGRARPTDLLDLVSHAPVVATFRGAVSTMNERLTGHPVRLALVALAITLPTALFVGVAVLKYVLGVAAPFDAIEPTVTPFITHPIGETILVLAPYVAFALAILPFARVRLGWREGRVTASAEAAVPLTSLAVGAMSAALIVFMGLYWVAENL